MSRIFRRLPRVFALTSCALLVSFAAFAQELRITDLSPDNKDSVLDRKTFLITAKGLSEEAAKPMLNGQEIPPSQVSRMPGADRKSTRLNSSHVRISYAVFCLKKK